MLNAPGAGVLLLPVLLSVLLLLLDEDDVDCCMFLLPLLDEDDVDKDDGAFDVDAAVGSSSSSSSSSPAGASVRTHTGVRRSDFELEAEELCSDTDPLAVDDELLASVPDDVVVWLLLLPADEDDELLGLEAGFCKEEDDAFFSFREDF